MLSFLILFHFSIKIDIVQDTAMLVARGTFKPFISLGIVFHRQKYCKYILKVRDVHPRWEGNFVFLWQCGVGPFFFFPPLETDLTPRKSLLQRPYKVKRTRSLHMYRQLWLFRKTRSCFPLRTGTPPLLTAPHANTVTTFVVIDTYGCAVVGSVSRKTFVKYCLNWRL